MATDKERSFCEMTCRTASRLGFGLKEDTVAGLFARFTWRSPQGELIACQANTGRQAALLQACRTLGARMAGL